MKIRIQIGSNQCSSGSTVHDTHVWMDEQEVTHLVRAVQVEHRVGEFPVVKLEMYVMKDGHVQIDHETDSLVVERLTC
jgi:hypothetical protein